MLESITALETRETFWLPHCSVKHTRSEASKAKSLVLNKLSLQDTLAVESKETLNQIKKKQPNKQIKTTTATKLNKNKKQEQTKDKGKKRLKVVVQCKFETSYR